jgi:lysozyme family protein
MKRKKYTSMKNSFKTGILALAIAIAATACKGNNASKAAPDSTKKDSTVADTSQTGKAPGANGAPGAMDTGIDKSGSGGTDTTKKP